ncbi:MAG: YidC/Oxa1 family membrane protein insertase [Spirochaetaceae bacterium]|nr:YidC/Oxa1 family membrane protein insertase [Spirochaetaceae bacterium]
MLDFLYNLIIYPLIQIIEVVYLVVWKVFKNSGYAVLGVSVAVTFLCLPLYIVAESWQEKERQIQKKLKPGIDRIKAVFKGDEQYMILSTFYRQNHYHPMMALRSSFGLLIQIPFFMAAYTYLSNLEELRGFSFWFIRDMGAPDAMFKIGNFNVNVLPIAMTLINCVAGAIYTKGLGLRDKLQVYGMAAVFLVLLYNSPAGLVLYWTMNNILSLVKNIFYKLKHPLKVLYICLCVGVLVMDYYLLFIHHGFLYRRLMLIAVLSLILISPLLIKFVNFLLKTVFKPLVDNQKTCTVIFFASAFTLCIMLGYVLPSFVIASSPQEFSFIDDYNSPFYFLFNATNQALGFLVFWPTCIYFLFGKKIKTLISVIFSIGALSALVNAFIFAGDYGMLSPILTFSNAGILKAPSSTNILNLLTLVVPILLVCVLIGFKKTRYLASATEIICLALVAVSIFNSTKISSGYAHAKELRNETAKTITTLEPVFNVSKTEPNVFIIMLDRAISSFLPYILEEKPELKEKLDGFIYYPNTLSYSNHTLIGAPPLFGGYDYTPVEINKRKDESLVEKHNEALLSMPVLFTENGFEATMADSSWANYSWISDMRIFDSYPDIKTTATIRAYTDLWLKEHPDSSEQGARSSLMKRNFIWYSLLKMMPTIFRDTIYNDGFYWNTNKGLEDLQDVVNNYASLDYLPELTGFTAENPTYTFMVNEMTHEPAYLQAPDYTPLAKVTNIGTGPFAEDVHYHANIGALLRVAEWLDYMKENDVYDNTRIIIVADHGAGVDSKLFPENFDLPFRPEAFNPLLLVKDFNSHGSIKTDTTFMTNADVPFLSTEGLIANPINPFTGNAITTEPKDNGVFVADSHLWSPDGQYKNTFKIKDDEWYFVHSDIFIPSNWTQEMPDLN